MESTLFMDFTIALLAALAGGMIADRLRQPPVIGYILGGITVGPFGLNLVRHLDTVSEFAEIGVILLMFTVGIEFSLSRLQKVGLVAVAGGGLQVLLTTLAGFAVGRWLGLPAVQGVVLGFAVAISSTMIVLKVLGDRGELNTRHGQVMLGILVVQDVAVVVMVALVPHLAGFAGGMGHDIVLSLLRSAALVAVAIFAAHRLVPPLMRRAAAGGNNDIFLLVALGLGLGLAAEARAVGLSPALGAFLVGVVISESEYSHEMLGKVMALRDTLVVVFFVSIGMLVDPSLLLAEPARLLAVLGLVAAKALLVMAIVRAFAYHPRVAFMSGVGLAQMGEFTFVLAGTALGAGVITAGLYNAILAASILTIVLTPLLLRAAPEWYARLAGSAGPSLAVGEGEGEEVPPQVSDHVILCGFGRVGSYIGSALQVLGVPFVVIEYDYAVNRRLAAAGVPCIYGDAGNETVLAQARPDLARMAILALPEISVSRRAVGALLKFKPGLPILARAHTDWDRDTLLLAGAIHAVQPEAEGGLQLVRHAIMHLDLPRERVEAYLETLYTRDFPDILQQRHYDALRAQALRAREFLVATDSPWAGCPLARSGIRERTGCTVSAIRRRNGELVINPAGEERLEPGDSFIATGTGEQLDALERIAGHRGPLPLRPYEALQAEALRPRDSTPWSQTPWPAALPL
ncbi:MAG: cation:proton antiporter, partial [Syntrophomonadaceae bacterium]|nr:cation:proton antiporter [Syntrophomonadaceae bacterium]